MPRAFTKDEIEDFFARLKKQIPEPKTELQSLNPYTLLVAVVLSAQATDKGVNKATEPLFKIADTPQKMVALGEDRLTRVHQDHRALSHQGEERHRAVEDADRAAWRTGAAHARGTGGAARRGAQDGQCGAERRLRRDDHRGRHAHLPRLQPHQPGAGQERAGGRAGARKESAGQIQAARASLADPARALYLHRAQAAVPDLRGARSVPLQGQDERAARRSRKPARAGGAWRARR